MAELKKKKLRIVWVDVLILDENLEINQQG